MKCGWCGRVLQEFGEGDNRMVEACGCVGERMHYLMEKRKMRLAEIDQIEADLRKLGQTEE